MAIKLPSWDVTATGRVGGVSARLQRDPMRTAAPQERFIPEVTSDQVTRHAQAQSAAIGAGGRAISAGLSSLGEAYNYVQKYNAGIEAEAAKQTYQEQMMTFTAQTMTHSPTVEIDLTTGKENKPWMTAWSGAPKIEDADGNLQPNDYVGVSEKIYDEVSDNHLGNKHAQKLFDTWRTSFDKSMQQKIIKWQTDKTIDLSEFRVEAAMDKANHPHQLHNIMQNALTTEDGTPALDATKVYGWYEKNLKRVNYQSLSTYIADAAIQIGRADGNFNLEDLEDLGDALSEAIHGLHHEGEVHKEPLLMDAQQAVNIKNSYRKLYDEYHTARTRQADTHFNNALIEGMNSDDPQTYWTSLVNESGARDKYLHNFDDMVELAQKEQRTGFDDRQVRDTLETMIAVHGGLNPQTDAAIERFIIRELIGYEGSSPNISSATGQSLLRRLQTRQDALFSRKFASAKATLGMLHFRSTNQANIDALLGSSGHAVEAATYQSQLNDLETYMMNNPNGDPVEYIEHMLARSVAWTSGWMVDKDGKPLSTSITEEGMGKLSDYDSWESARKLEAEYRQRKKDANEDFAGQPGLGQKLLKIDRWNTEQQILRDKMEFVSAYFRQTQHQRGLSDISSRTRAREESEKVFLNRWLKESGFTGLRPLH